MRTNIKTTLLLIVNAFLILIFALGLNVLTVSAKNLYTINLYDGTKYETEEELKNLETILRADGYICVSSWCSDDSEKTEALRDTYFSCIDFLDYKDFKVFISPVSLESCLNGGFDNMDTVIINSYAFSEEAQKEEGGIAYNYTQNPNNIVAGMEGTGTLTIDSVINEEIAEKYKYTTAVLIFTSYDHGKSFEIDLSPANGYNGVYTISNGNYYIQSIFLGEDCTPEYEVSDFTIADGIGATLTFDFTANWEKKPEATIKEQNEDTDIEASDVLDIVEDEPVKKNYIPLIVTVSSFVLLGIIGLIVFIIFKKKLSNGSM